MLPQQRKAIAKFKEPAHALAFQQKFHRYPVYSVVRALWGGGRARPPRQLGVVRLRAHLLPDRRTRRV